MESRRSYKRPPWFHSENGFLPFMAELERDHQAKSSSDHFNKDISRRRTSCSSSRCKSLRHSSPAIEKLEYFDEKKEESRRLKRRPFVRRGAFYSRTNRESVRTMELSDNKAIAFTILNFVQIETKEVVRAFRCLKTPWSLRYR